MACLSVIEQRKDETFESKVKKSDMVQSKGRMHEGRKF